MNTPKTTPKRLQLALETLTVLRQEDSQRVAGAYGTVTCSLCGSMCGVHTCVLK